MKHSTNILVKLSITTENYGKAFNWDFYGVFYANSCTLRILNWAYPVKDCRKEHFFKAGKVGAWTNCQIQDEDLFYAFYDRLVNLDAPTIRQLKYGGTLKDWRLQVQCEEVKGWITFSWLYLLKENDKVKEVIAFDDSDVSYTCR